jgi:hypothetical protein
VNPYTVHDASRENAGTPTFNVKGPGGYDKLVFHMYAKRAKSAADGLAEDLNEAFRLGRESAKQETAQ